MKAVIFGAGGLGRLVQNILADSGAAAPYAYLDSNPALHGRRIDGLEVRGDLSAAIQLTVDPNIEFCVAIGDPFARCRVARALLARGARLMSVIHPQSTIAPSAHLGRHLIIGPRATICVNSSIGDHSVILTGAIVEHDNQLGVGVVLHPAVRLAGGVVVEDEAVLGIGACVIPGRRIGARAMVAPGTVVIRNVAGIPKLSDAATSAAANHSASPHPRPNPPHSTAAPDAVPSIVG